MLLRIGNPLLSLVLSGAILVFHAAVDTARAGGAAARGDTTMARREAPVFSSPVAESRVVARVRTGTHLRVLERKSRWVKVRIDGRAGWITWASVALAPPARVPERPAHRRAVAGGPRLHPRSPTDAPRERSAFAIDEEPAVEDLDEAAAERVRRARNRAALERRRSERCSGAGRARLVSAASAGDDLAAVLVDEYQVEGQAAVGSADPGGRRRRVRCPPARR